MSESAPTDLVRHDRYRFMVRAFPWKCSYKKDEPVGMAPTIASPGCSPVACTRPKKTSRLVGSSSLMLRAIGFIWFFSLRCIFPGFFGQRSSLNRGIGPQYAKGDSRRFTPKRRRNRR
jgi:hypothetical protein